MTRARRLSWVWFAVLCSTCAGLLPGQNVTFTSTPLNGVATAITVGPDGNLWFVEGGFSASTVKIGRMTTAGVLTEFPTGIGPGGVCLGAITSGPDGNLWVALGNAAGPGTFGPILKVSTAGVILNQYQTPQSASCVLSLTRGPDGALWGTEAVISGDQIIRITTSGAMTQFAIPEGGGAADPSMIVTGADGNLWFTENPGFRIGSVTTSGVFNDRLLPGITFNGSSYVGPTLDLPLGITLGPDGAIWFTEEGSSIGVGAAPSKIGRITTGGTITEFATPTAFSSPFTITNGPDGALWFTEASSNKLGRITTGGTFSEFAITSGSAPPTAIVSGPDGALWFAQGSFASSTGTIGHAVLSNAPQPTPAPSALILTLAAMATLGLYGIGRRVSKRDRAA